MPNHRRVEDPVTDPPGDAFEKGLAIFDPAYRKIIVVLSIVFLLVVFVSGIGNAYVGHRDEAVDSRVHLITDGTLREHERRISGLEDDRKSMVTDIAEIKKTSASQAADTLAIRQLLTDKFGTRVAHTK